ncbi:peptidoglycan DD-metalloendopeptidase family protein [Paenibacillus sp. LMG 31459]|uniref:Peptidoglycan DD-metalloendopeptidase family protein n=1 Tax=Paenibacillus phytohabitans TaxID=2654978 RepID=A0ABX1YI35_9BACL|nr:peptidoglycan DD-metalloendopeptidase family protein [Paenibacillus phytohabitans]
MEVVKKAKEMKKIIGVLSALSSPGIGLVLIFLGLAALVVLFVFLPFMIFSDTDSYKPQTAGQYAWMAPVQLDVDGTAYVWPVPTIDRVSSPFALRDLFGTTRMHKGIDIANGAANTELQAVYAMAAGTVTMAGAASGYGQAIMIDHGNGLVTIYGHLSTQMNVSVGDVVSKGQLIGAIGQGIVGRSTGPHLHFQVELNRVPVDPLEYVFAPGTEIPTLPRELGYQSLNIEYVLQFLEKRKSALADRSLLQMIDEAGRIKNVSPYLLIAITGQEQSFVPRNNNHASEIIRNPWNVFGCWCKGKGAQLSTGESAQIAANTIIKLSQDLPAGRDPIQWLSAKDNPRGYYAAHNGWWIGVSKYFKLLVAGSG